MAPHVVTGLDDETDYGFLDDNGMNCVYEHKLWGDTYFAGFSGVYRVLSWGPCYAKVEEVTDEHILKAIDRMEFERIGASLNAAKRDLEEVGEYYKELDRIVSCCKPPH